ncbi:MAG: type VI secretion system baseplate subunit TssF [Polyangiaceae bacterium]
MDARLLAYYDRELRYLRELGGEFAAEFPKVAARLGLDSFECSDPYVERLLEGFAFMAARVQLKIDAEFPRFTEQLLDALCPHYLGPTPSMAVVQLKPDSKQGALNTGFVVPRGTALRGNLRRGDSTACEFRTAHEVTLWPVEVTRVVHALHGAELAPIQPAWKGPAKASLRITLRTTNEQPFSALPLDRLPLFVRGSDAASLRLLEALLGSVTSVSVRYGDSGAAIHLPEATVGPMGLDDDQALLPAGPRSFQGYRLLQEYFAFPSRLFFAEIAGLREALRRATTPEVEIVLALSRHDRELEAGVDATRVALFCTPAVNLFPKRADRITLSDRDHEMHVVADRTRPMDFEVHSVVEVTGIGARGDERREFAPLYGRVARQSATGESAAFYTVRRAPRPPSSVRREKGPRSSYLGGEVFLSLADGNGGPFRSDLQQLAVSALCTNRDLTLRMPVGQGRTDFVVESGAPVESVRCLAGPSLPRPSHAWGDTSWRIISHLSLNYLSLADSEDSKGATALRELLGLYGDLTDAAVKRHIEGVRSAVARPVVRRLPLDGPATFARGIELTVECDEQAFEGASTFALGLVLDRFFGRYVSINSFVETVLRSTQRGEVARWAAKMGRRPAI